MRIGFDAIRALHNTTGLGNYARNLLRGLHALDPSLQLHLYSPKPPAEQFRKFPAEVEASVHLPSPTPHAPRLLPWRTFRLGRTAARDGMQLYHGLTHEIPRDLPRTGIKSVVTFADLIFEKHPKYFPRIDRWSYRWRYRWSAAHADAIVAISAQTRDDLVELYHIDPARIAIVPPARNPIFAANATDGDRATIRSKYGLPNEFLLSVGTLEPRKNQQILIGALQRARKGGLPPLVLVGRDGGSHDFLEKLSRGLGLRDRVIFLSHVETADLPALMQSATLFLYPSQIEGFGMPIVEALSAGTPVVASAGGCFVEAGGPGSRYAGAGDVDAWAAAITDLVADSQARDRMRGAGIVYARQFDGDRVAARLLGVYDAVMTKRALT